MNTYADSIIGNRDGVGYTGIFLLLPWKEERASKNRKKGVRKLERKLLVSKLPEW